MGSSALDDARTAGVTVAPEEAASLDAASTFRRERHALALEQADRLAERLPLPQIRLPFVFGEIGPDDIDELADVLVDGVAGARRSRSQRSGSPRSGLVMGADMGNGLTLDQLITERHVVVCCGTGGVGKTTTAAVLALAAARRGRDAVVVTIDPAKRLADTLGLESLGNTAQEISRDRWDPAESAPPSGRLSGLMLDTRSTFDALVRNYATDAEQAERILGNRFYRNIAGALSGTQEYMAMEKLHELHEEGGHDLIVIDTPPTRHALDFLDAPARLTRLLDNRIFRFLITPTRTYLRVAGVAVQTFLRTVGKVVGSEVVDDIVAFFRAFEGMEQGFRERAASVTSLLADDGTAFVLVTSPRRDAVEEAEFFAKRLRESGLARRRARREPCPP